MGLKSALFEMKEYLKNQQADLPEEDFIKEIETKNNLIEGSLVYYYNNLLLLNMKQSDYEPSDDSKKNNRKWSKNEIELMFQYIQERQTEGHLNITEILDEVAQILDRGYQSINYKYYSLIKKQGTKKASNQNTYHFTTISEKDVPVISAEMVKGTNSQIESLPLNSSKNDDLLDILSGLITNIQQLPGINLNDLLRSLYHLTNLALQNQNAALQIENLKSEINLETESLRNKLQKKDQQLMQEKKRNDELQFEVSKLAKEIAAFNQLGDAAKIQNLKAYSQRLNYIIDGSGVVLQVGS